MKLLAILMPLVTLVLLSSGGCAPRVSRSGYTTADLKPKARCDVDFAYRSQLGSNEARELGRIRVGDTGFSTNCSEPEVREIVRREACGLDADVVDIQDEKAPSAMATCYHMDARFLALTNGSITRQVLSEPPPLEKESQDSDRAKRAKQNNRKLVRSLLIAGVVAGVAAGITVGVMTAP